MCTIIGTVAVVECDIPYIFLAAFCIAAIVVVIWPPFATPHIGHKACCLRRKEEVTSCLDKGFQVRTESAIVYRVELVKSQPNARDIYPKNFDIAEVSIGKQFSILYILYSNHLGGCIARGKPRKGVAFRLVAVLPGKVCGGICYNKVSCRFFCSRHKIIHTRRNTRGNLCRSTDC